MTLADVIERTASIIGAEGDVTTYPTQLLNKLKDCVCTVYAELITEHIPLKTKEKATLSGNRIYFEDLNFSVREILKISSPAGRHRFNVFDKHVEVENCPGEAEVEYLYYFVPEELTDELVLPPQYSVYIMAVGAAAEYFYRSSLLDEAMFFRNRFESGINNLSRSGRIFALPKRRLL